MYFIVVNMTATTRAMRRKKLETTQSLLEKRQLKIIEELQTGISNLQLVIGREYKKYMIYAIFDYMCEVKEDLYLLGAHFGYNLNIKLNQLLKDSKSNIHNDKDFHQACMYYEFQLRDYIAWSKEKIGMGKR